MKLDDGRWTMDDDSSHRPSSIVHRPLTWCADDQEAGERLDRTIADRFEDISRSFAASLIEAGAVRVNGEVADKPSRKLKAGDQIEIDVPPPQPSGLTAESIPLDVVYEDSDLLVVDKPAGMVVHPAPGHSGGTLVNALLAHVPEWGVGSGEWGVGTLDETDSPPIPNPQSPTPSLRPGIVHRLDKDTSGLIVVAKHRKAHDRLARQMSQRTMLKEYVAVVAGRPKPDAGVIDAPIARDPRDRQRMAVVYGGRAARTRYAVERELGKYTMLRVTLETGRTHQIRVHMASIGHPVLGDPVYGKRTLKDAASLGLTRQFLHARRLGFTLPSTGEWREFESELPGDLRGALEEIERKSA